MDNSPYVHARHGTPIGCRSSANYVSAAMAKFDEKKKELVRSIGFGGVLELHEMSKVNRVFSHWLLSSTNWEDGFISAGDHIKLKIVSEDIEKIIGIPARGRDVLASSLKEEDKADFLEKHMSFLGPENSMISTAEAIILRDLPLDMTKQDTDQFKIAFVVFIMGRFLAPTTVFYHGNYNFWHTLLNPDEIKEYNWSAYVLSCLLDSARVLYFGKILKKQVSSITGCPILLQIFYLDNIDLGSLNLRHDVFPRIKAFDCSLLAKMINADTDKVYGSFGCSKLRPRCESCYALPDTTLLSVPNNASPFSRARSSTSQKKRRFHSLSASPKSTSSTDATLIDSSPKMALSTAGKFPTYIRTKYPEYVQDKFIEALRYHNARCIQQINNHKNALTAAIVSENMALADKYIEHISKESASGIPKYPRKGTKTNRKAYEDLLSGPESGSEAEDQLNRCEHEKNDGFIVDPVPQVVKNGSQLNQGSHVPKTRHFIREKTVIENFDSSADCSNGQYPVIVNIESIGQTSMKNNQQTNHSKESGSSSGPADTPEDVPDDTGFHTPYALSKMAPVSPELSPTAANKIHSDYALTLRMMSSLVDMDLNSRPADAEYNNSPIAKKFVKLGRFARSHWSIGRDHPERDPSVTGSLFDWVSTTNSNELDRSWIIHDTPRYIICKGHDFKKEFFSGNAMSYDLFDICVRRLQQLDNIIYPDGSRLRWRHMFESDFAMHALGSEIPASSKSVRDQFVGIGVSYELHRCRMLFIPVQGKGVWWAYALDLRENNVYIIDPSIDSNNFAYVLSKHSGTIKLVLESLKATISTLFDGWQLHCDDFDHVVLRTTTTGCPRPASAFYTLYCIKNFDGDSTIHVSESIISKFKQYLMYELFGLRDNRGTLPSVYVQTIDD